MVNGFEVLGDGTHAEVDVKRGTLDSAKVYCVVDHSNRNIFVWLGNSANVRLRFVGAQTASTVKSDLSVHYKVTSIDEGDEPNIFFHILDSSTSEPELEKTTTSP